MVESLPKLKMYINGEFVDPVSGDYFESLTLMQRNPGAWFHVVRRMMSSELSRQRIKRSLEESGRRSTQVNAASFCANLGNWSQKTHRCWVS